MTDQQQLDQATGENSPVDMEFPPEYSTILDGLYEAIDLSVADDISHQNAIGMVNELVDFMVDFRDKMAMVMGLALAQRDEMKQELDEIRDGLMSGEPTHPLTDMFANVIEEKARMEMGTDIDGWLTDNLLDMVDGSIADQYLIAGFMEKLTEQEAVMWGDVDFYLDEDDNRERVVAFLEKLKERVERGA